MNRGGPCKAGWELSLIHISIVLPHSQGIRESVGGVIERQHIISNIHVAVVVDPLGRHRTGVQLSLIHI